MKARIAGFVFGALTLIPGLSYAGTLFIDPADGEFGDTFVSCPYMSYLDPSGPSLSCSGNFFPNSDGTWTGVVSVDVPFNAVLGFYGYGLNVWWDYPAFGTFLTNHDEGPYVLDFFSVNVVGTPEPGTLALLGLGLAGLGLSRRRKAN